MPPPSGPPPVLSKLLHKRNSIKYRDYDEDVNQPLELKPIITSSPEATGTIDHPLMPVSDDEEIDAIPSFLETSQDDIRSLGSIDSTSEPQEPENNGLLLTPDDSGIYWQTEISLMKNQTEQIHVGLVSHGKYLLSIEKCDALARVLSVQLVLSRGGVVIKKERFYIGGMKALGKCFNYHFALKQNTRVDISFKSKAITNVSPLKVVAVLKREEKDDRTSAGKSTPPIPALLKNPPFRKTSWNEEEGSQDSSEDGAAELSPRSLSSKQGDSSIKVLQNLENVSFTKPFTVTQKLEAGYYYFGVRNDSGKQIAPDLRKMVASMQILRHDGVIIQEETYPEFLKVTDLPWKKNFNISPPQAPATLTITLKPTSVPAVTASIKITTAPDPNSFEEIMKRTKDLRMKIAAVVAALLFLSYGWQIVSFIFALEIPFVRISVRLILTVVVGVYGYQNRHEILEIIRHKSQATQQKLSFFKELDEKDSGLEKIKLLTEEGKRKREVRKLLKEAQMGL